jgi:hypothetical protein
VKELPARAFVAESEAAVGAAELSVDVIRGVPFVADFPGKSLGDSGIASGAAVSLHGVSSPRPTAIYSARSLPSGRKVNLQRDPRSQSAMSVRFTGNGIAGPR